MKQIYLMSIIIIALLTSCKNKDIEYQFVNRNFPQKINISKLGILKFELDSVTGPLTPSLQEYDNKNASLLIYLNEETGVLYINDLKTRKIIKRIQVEGDSLKYKKYFQGFYYHNSDSIFLFSYHPSVTLVNDKGAILNKYNLINEKFKPYRIFFKGVYVTTNCPAYFHNNFLIINSVVVGENEQSGKKYIQMKLNLNTGVDNIGTVSIPDEYYHNNYGGLHYDIYSACFNPNTNDVIYSFPANKKVIINHLKSDSISEANAESEFIEEFITYNEKNYADAKSEAVGEYFMTTPTYGSIFYDKYKDVYYRLALLPVEEKNVNYEEKNHPIKHISLMVFDKHFKYLGEKLLDKNIYWASSCFVSKDGLNIQNRTNSDATLDFTTFTFK